MMMEQTKIDFAVTWLDSTDVKWQQEYNHYKGIKDSGDQSSARFRDWDLFRYWFRAVETYAPWVNRVFLITNGTLPKWINLNHPKLVPVSHEDYIPKEFLPTFNSCAIELHMNKIKELSEHFVYFNDDCYINAPITPEYYFRDGLPCDCNAETFFNVPIYNAVDRFNICISVMADIGVLNAHFDRRQVVKQSFRRWYGLHLWRAGLINSLVLSMYGSHRFVGFNSKHVEQPFLKSIFDEVWSKEPDILEQSCTRFREEVTLNPYVFRYWQLASNRFYPVRRASAKKYRTIKRDMPNILKAIFDPKIKSLCINDTPECTDEEFVAYSKALKDAFEKKLPNKSSFEL